LARKGPRGGTRPRALAHTPPCDGEVETASQLALPIGLGESGDQRERNGEPWLATALAMAVADVGECDSCAEPESASELMDRCGLCAM